MIVEIITPEKEFFKGEAISVKVPGSMGEFEILENLTRR
jgi:F0F1-type ATP synthase epsilon subunit